MPPARSAPNQQLNCQQANQNSSEEYLNWGLAGLLALRLLGGSAGNEGEAPVTVMASSASLSGTLGQYPTHRPLPVAYNGTAH
jgi:hypothetical protein